MEKNSSRFTHIIYNQDNETISFIQLGKPSLKERLRFLYKPCKNRKNFAVLPRTIEEFLFCLENTNLAPSRNYNDYSFKCFRIKPSKGIEDEIAFNWIATTFGSRFIDSPDNLRIFINKCNIIKQEKLNKLTKPSTERE